MGIQVDSMDVVDHHTHYLYPDIAKIEGGFQFYKTSLKCLFQDKQNSRCASVFCALYDYVRHLPCQHLSFAMYE